MGSWKLVSPQRARAHTHAHTHTRAHTHPPLYFYKYREGVKGEQNAINIYTMFILTHEILTTLQNWRHYPLQNEKPENTKGIGSWHPVPSLHGK